MFVNRGGSKQEIGKNFNSRSLFEMVESPTQKVENWLS